VPSCAGAYVSGAAGSNACPAGSVRIETQAACRTAATAAGKTVSSFFVVTDPYVPRGCYYASSSASVYDNYAYFNPHPVGYGDFFYRLLCAVTSGAPRAHTCACSGYSRGTGYCAGSWVVCCGVLTTYCTGARTSVGHALPRGCGADVPRSVGQRRVVRGASQSGTLPYSTGTHGVLCGTRGQRIGCGGQSTAVQGTLSCALYGTALSDTHWAKPDGPSVPCTRWSGVK
jgi:hypothetical protein